jgi:MFS superfamily sulfate permease-like transporter
MLRSSRCRTIRAAASGEERNAVDDPVEQAPGSSGSEPRRRRRRRGASGGGEAAAAVYGDEPFQQLEQGTAPSRLLGWVERLDRYADVSLHPSARVTPGVVVYRLDGALLFVNVAYFKARVREAIVAAGSHTRHLVLSAEGVNDIDASGADAALAMVESLRAEGITFVVARLKGHVRRQFDDVRLTDAIGAENFFDTVSAAVRDCAARLGAADAPGGEQ